MKKTTVLGVLLTMCALCLSLTSCIHEHAWSQAACTQPKTCTECGETEGEALGHTWRSATCVKPRTCSVCGETEGQSLGHTWRSATCAQPRTCTECGRTTGEALGHTWTAADCTQPETCSVCGAEQGEALGHTWKGASYQAPARCVVCGVTEGSALTPDFVAYGIAADMEAGVHYDYETVTYDDERIKTVGDVVILSYEVFTSDYTHEAKAGYEWKVATVRVTYSDENAWYNGYRTGICYEDYYNIRLSDDSAVYDDDGRETFTVNYKGEETAAYRYTESFSSGWQEDHRVEITFIVNYLVPVGYDGCVFGVFDRGLVYPDNGYIFDIYSPDSFHLFRFV